MQYPPYQKMIYRAHMNIRHLALDISDLSQYSLFRFCGRRGGMSKATQNLKIK